MTPNKYPLDMSERRHDTLESRGDGDQKVANTPTPVRRGQTSLPVCREQSEVVDDIKIDAAGWQVPPDLEGWTTVCRSAKPTKTRPLWPSHANENTPGKVWRETTASKLARADKRRAVAFRDSLMYGRSWEPLPQVHRQPIGPDLPSGVREITPIISVPSDSSPVRPFVSERTSKSLRRSVRRVASRAGTNASSLAPLPTVSKDEAAAPVPRLDAVEPPRPPRALAEPPEQARGPGFVEHHKTKGSTFIDNAASRLATVTYTSHHLRQTHFLGVARKLMSDSLFSEMLGVLVTLPDNFTVRLPSNCVAEFGAWWVGRAPSADNFASYQEFVRRWCQRVDWEHGSLQEDCLMYGAYLGFVTRATERADLARRVHGRVFTRCAQVVVLAGAALGGLTSIPVAAAAATVGAPALTVAAAPFAGIAAATIAVGLAVKWALPWFAQDMAFVKDSDPIRSVTCTAAAPPQKPDARIERVEAKREHDKIRVAAHPTGTCLLGYEPTVFAQNQDNVVAALEKRSAAASAPGDRVAFLKWVEKHWETLIAKIFDLRIPLDPCEQDAIVEDWLATSNSSPAVKARVRLAWSALRADGHHMHTPIPSSLAWEWSKRDVSAKNEALTKDESGHPRQIMAAPPQFVALVAPFVKRLTGVIRRSLRDGPLVYTPGRSEEEISQMMTDRDWDQEANEDFNAYDSNQGLDMGQTECRIFKRYGAPVATRQVMVANLDVHGGSREGVKFSVPYCRLSGDPQTTLMNTVWNLLANAFVYCEARSCHPRDMDVLFFAGGDDGKLCYNGERIDFEGGLARLGLPATVKHTAHRNEVEFLSCRLTRTSRGWRLIPKLGRLFIKFAFSVRATEFNGREILAGGVNSVREALSGSPIGRLFIAHWDRICGQACPIRPKDEPWKLAVCNTGNPTDETWDDLYAQYGWTRELHEALERDLACVRDAGTTVASAALQILVDTDSSRKERFLPQASESDSEEPPQAGGWVADLTDVGVEPNPGWSLSRVARNRAQHALNGNIRNRRVVVVARRRPRRGPAQTAVVARQQGARRVVVRRRRRAPGRLGGNANLVLGSIDERKYMCTLNDPFNCPPVRLGAGCSQPTGLATLYSTTVFTPGATQMAIFVWPRSSDPFLTTTGTSNPYTYATGSLPSSFPQASSLATIANAARVVSMGVKVTSSSSATNDNGVVTMGLLPRDPVAVQVTSGSLVVLPTTTVNGLPLFATTSASVGSPEILNFEQTESFALRKGATAFWRPLDPLDFEFNEIAVNNPYSAGGGAGGAIPSQAIVGNPIVIGLTGISTSSTVMLEVVLHLEYTKGPFVASVVNVGTGTMTSSFVERAADIVFGANTNTVREGITSGFQAAGNAIGGAIAGGVGRAIGSTIGRAAGNITNRLANYFSSTDAQGSTALVPSSRGRRYNMMEVD